MEFETDYWIEEPSESDGLDTFRPGIRGIITRFLLLVLLIWVLIQMVLPRRALILQIDQHQHPPAEPIEPIYWL